MNVLSEIIKLLPSKLNFTRIVNSIFVWLLPLRRMNAQFLAFKESTEFSRKFNSQVLKLERRLNLHFQNAGITIDTVEDNTGQFIFFRNEGSYNNYIYFRSENQNSFYIKFRSEIINETVDFIVNVSGQFEYDLNEMKAIIDLYKLPSIKYKIQIY